MRRGALIVIEGVDRTGKSTQCKSLVERLVKQQIQAEYANFPARQTEVGKLINNYLTSKDNLSDETIHLLFSANRWECAKTIVNKLELGISLIIDRYCYSGVAFSAAKGLDINWCKASDVGLPRPDKVFFLTMPLDKVQQRNGFGGERYEVPEFQKRVSAMYENLKEDNWEVIDATRSKEDINEELFEKSIKLIENVGDKTICKMWQK